MSDQQKAKCLQYFIITLAIVVLLIFLGGLIRTCLEDPDGVRSHIEALFEALPSRRDRFRD